MTPSRRPRPGRARRLAAAIVALGLLAGCDGQTDYAATLREFVTEFARAALAAFLL